MSDHRPAAHLRLAPDHTLRPRVAVIAPCRNEAAAVADVVRGFRTALPDAEIFVYDNLSTDETADRARAAGAIVRKATIPGKGAVVRRMFADIEADIYVLVDGDATYDAAAAPAMIALLEDSRLDMVVGVRVEEGEGAYRRGHRFGNKMLTGLVALFFGRQVSDMLSGYRVFSRRFVKSFPALSRGFEIETELTVHALEIGAAVGELPTRYVERPAGSASKLRTFRDGARILRLIIDLVREERPMTFFMSGALVLLLASLAVAVPVLMDYLATGLVPRLPSWVFSVSLFVLAALSSAVGFVLDTVTRGRREMKRLAYLAIPR